VWRNHKWSAFFWLAQLPQLEKIDNPLSGLSIKQNWEVYGKFVEFLDRTFLSDWVSESVKNWRAIICMKAIDPAEIILRIPDPRLCHVQGPIHGIEDRQFCPHRQVPRPSWRPTPALFADAIVTYILASVKRRDGSWFALASDELGVPEPVLSKLRFA